MDGWNLFDFYRFVVIVGCRSFVVGGGDGGRTELFAERFGVARMPRGFLAFSWQMSAGTTNSV